MLLSLRFRANFSKESLFSSMTAEKWHAALGPKIKGTWNLHNAIRGQESGLEFFLMTSSLSGSIVGLRG